MLRFILMACHYAQGLDHLRLHGIDEKFSNILHIYRSSSCVSFCRAQTVMFSTFSRKSLSKPTPAHLLSQSNEESEISTILSYLSVFFLACCLLATGLYKPPHCKTSPFVAFQKKIISLRVPTNSNIPRTPKARLSCPTILCKSFSLCW